jgi:hypothetical protein
MAFGEVEDAHQLAAELGLDLPTFGAGPRRLDCREPSRRSLLDAEITWRMKLSR